MDFRILGPLEVYDRGKALPLGAGKQRAVLALLLLHANEVVSADRLIDELWGEAPPPPAAKILQNYVSQLRRPLSDGVLLTRGHGYVLRVEPGELDLDRFRQLVDEGRRALGADDPERASGVLREALDLWRGRALEDFAYEPFARDEIPRLEELRLTALMERIDADLALGRHTELGGELEALIAQHPLQERLRGQLMLALYRSGRQAEALHVYQEARRMLVEELGIEPGQTLQQLETAILRQDQSLEPPAPRRKVVLDTVTARPSRLRALLAAAALLAVGAGTAAGILLSRGHAAKPLTAVAPNSVGVIDPRTNKLVGEVAVGNYPRIAVGRASVWAINAGDGTVSLIDPQTMRVERTLAVQRKGAPSSIAFSGDSAWVVASGGYRFLSAGYAEEFSSDSPGTLARIFTDQGQINTVSVFLNRISYRDVPDVAVGFDTVWVTTQIHPAVITVDARVVDRGSCTTYPCAPDVPLAKIVKEVRTPAVPLAIAIGDGAVWLTGFDPSSKAGVLARIDPARRNVVATIPLPAIPGDLAVGYGAVWVTVNSENAVWRIDPRTNSVAQTIQVGDGPFAVAVGEGAVWVVNAKDATVSRIDPSTNRVVAAIRVGGSPRDVAVGSGRVWVAVS